jgi:hypothetical protein
MLVVGFAVFLGSLNVPVIYKLLKHGGQTTARIVRTDCGNHSSGSYAYVVRGVPYLGGDVMSSDCEQLHKGQEITVYYDLTDPRVSIAEQPMASLENELMFIALVCLVFPPVIMIGVARAIVMLRRGPEKFN